MVAYQKKHSHNRAYNLNSFRLLGLEKIDVGYRLIEPTGLLEDDDDYEKKMRLAATILSGRLKMPVEPIYRGDEARLAIIGLNDKLSEIKVPEVIALNPEAVSLSLEDKTHTLSFKFNNDRIQMKLARRVLTWTIENALNRQRAGWWKYGKRFVSRKADENLSTEEIQVFLAFYFGFVAGAYGSFEISIDPSVCYAERVSQHEKHGRKIPSNVKGKRFLYRNGYDWYPITAVAVGASAEKEKMIDPVTDKPISIQERLKNRWGNKNINSINKLDKNAQTIAYKTGSNQSRRAHSQLLYELVGVNGTEEGADSPHNESIMSDAKRGRMTEQLIKDIAPHLNLFGHKLNPKFKMRRLNKEVTIFSPPVLQFGEEEQLTTDLKNMGRDRFKALKYFGPAEKSSFADKQLFIEVESLPEDVRRDFKKGLLKAISEIYGQAPTFKTLTVNDSFSHLLREQYNEIMDTIGEQKGYGLLILPKGRLKNQQSKLHNQLKRDLWGNVQTQMASAEKILEFFIRTKNKYGEEQWVVRNNKRGLYRSYLRYLALGYLEVNRKWLWKFAEGTLRNEVHIGIDVYKGLAVFTFIYGDSELITFHLSKSIRPERLTADQIYQALFENLTKDLKDLGISPSRIVIHRDGRTFESEKRGIRRVFKELKLHNLLPTDFRYAIVDIHKTSSSKSRLYLNYKGKYNNPDMGALAELSKFEGVLATTGKPLLRRGTAQPLYLELVEGEIDLVDVAHDIYALSHLSFASPGSAMGLPFTIALCDRILRESSPGEDLSLWEDEKEESKIIKHKTAVRSFM